MTGLRTFSPLCLAAVLAFAGTAQAQAQADGARRGGRDAGAQAPRAAEQRPRPAQAPAPAAQAQTWRPVRNDALTDSIRRVQARTGGQVLSAERVPFEGRDINRVKVVDDRGRVRVYMDDPASGPRRPPRPARGADE